MNVALVILHADPARGGAERYTRDLAAGMVGRDHAVSLLATSFGDVPAGVKMVRIDARHRTRVGRYERFLAGVDTATSGFDIVHAMLPVRRCELYHPHAGVAAEAVAAAGWTGHLNRRRVRFAKVERQLLGGPRSPIVLCLSGLIRAAVRTHYPSLAEDRLTTLFNGTDLSRFDPGPVPDPHGSQTRATALMMAQDFARKGLREAIVALRDVPGWSLVVGGRDDPDPYKKQAAQLGVGDRLTFLGNVADPARFYRSADFFILPTKRDPCSLVVLEALAMGVPVISTAQNGACEIMVDGVHGRVVADPADAAALADAVRSVLVEETRTRMAAACLALRPALSQEHHLDAVERAYAAALAP